MRLMDELLAAMKLARGAEPGTIRRRGAAPTRAAEAVPARSTANKAPAVKADRSGVASPPEVMAEAGRTRVAKVSAPHLHQYRVLEPGARGAVASSYKILRTQVLQRCRREGIASVAVVSPSQQDGRTLTAINLAVSIAEDPEHTALLVDLDLVSPSVHQCFGIKVERGVEGCLRGEYELASALVRPSGYDKLVLLPAKGAVQQSSELLASERTRRLAQELRERYANRVVIYDLPALFASDDALSFLPLVDAALLVVAEGRTRRDEVARALELMRETTVIGTVLNRSRERLPDQG
jgi:Mrp family chromosome partitioning ATPase